MADKNLNAVVWLYRDEAEKYKKLLSEYHAAICDKVKIAIEQADELEKYFLLK